MYLSRDSLSILGICIFQFMSTPSVLGQYRKRYFKPTLTNFISDARQSSETQNKLALETFMAFAAEQMSGCDTRK